MSYTLLTGATGLLGRYLLADLLLGARNVAVLVRPTRRESAEARVDRLLSLWEQRWKRNLPRPLVLTGDILAPSWGLDAADRRWLSRRADRVLHSAASLTFHEEDGEPWASNVGAVETMLRLCEETGIRLVEHVSTAYTCGLRTGRVLESELDVGQEFGNDYEKSKLHAEKLIRSARGLDAYTVFRPSIIVGDSQTGYTSTYHGLYAPLRVASALGNVIGIGDALEVDYLALLGMKASDRKNFVPVDWVSEAIVSISSQGRPRNQTYALVTEHPVSTERLRRIFENSVREHLERLQVNLPVKAKGASAGGTESRIRMEFFQRQYVEQFSVYKSYWKDDPVFDCSNTKAALPGLPCPALTDERLMLLCTHALKTNFGFPPPKIELPTFLPRQWFSGLGAVRPLPSPSVNGSNGRDYLSLTITGPGGGDWVVSTGVSGSLDVERGARQDGARARMTADTFGRIVKGELSVDDALAESRVLLQGHAAASDRLRRFASSATARQSI